MKNKTYFLCRFFFKDAKGLTSSVFLLFCLILIQLGYIFHNEEDVLEGLLTLIFIILFLVTTHAFEQTLYQDLQDGSFEWFLSQKISIFTYFFSKCFVFMVTVLLPLLTLITFIQSLQNLPWQQNLTLWICLFLAGIQTVLISGSLSLGLLICQQNLNFSLPFCLLPLQIPNLIILRAVETQQMGSLSAILFLIGLSLLAVATSQAIVKAILKPWK